MILVLAACSNSEEYPTESGDPSAIIDNDIGGSGLSTVGLAISTQENVLECKGTSIRKRDPFVKGKVNYLTNRRKKGMVYDFCNNSLLTEVFCINSKKVGYEKGIICQIGSSCTGNGVCKSVPINDTPRNDTPQVPVNGTPQNNTPPVNNTPVVNDTPQNNTPPTNDVTPIVNNTPGNSTPPSGNNTPIVNNTPVNDTPGNSS